MRMGHWIAFCQRSELVELEDLRDLVNTWPDLEAALTDGELVVTANDTLSGNQANIYVGINREPEAVDEFKELLDEAESARDRDTVRAADAYYELAWPLREGDESYIPMLWIAEALQSRCSAVVFDLSVGRFVLAPLH